MCRTHNCQSCGASFDEKPSCANKYCSRDCYHVARCGGKRPWADCSECLASIGFGTKITGRLLGINPTSILGQRKKDGIEAQTPSIGSWRIWARRKAAGKNPDRKRTREERLFHSFWMKDIKTAHSKGFTWDYIWSKEKARRIAADKYENMSHEEKKEHNAKCISNHQRRIKSNPNKYRKQRRQWRSEYYTRNPAQRIIQNLRSRLSVMIRNNINGDKFTNNNTLEFIGCTAGELHRHLELQFDHHMSWENYGTYWHLDHIIPCAAFDHSDPKQVAQCWHHSNMQPLEASENLRKSDQFNEEQLNLLINQTNDKAGPL